MTETKEMSVIERAARALQTAWDKHDAPATLPPLTFTDDEGRYLVRAVLQAIREPSPAMAIAGSMMVPNNEEDWEPAEPREIWQAMIDAALSE